MVILRSFGLPGRLANGGKRFVTSARTLRLKPFGFFSNLDLKAVVSSSQNASTQSDKRSGFASGRGCLICFVPLRRRAGSWSLLRLVPWQSPANSFHCPSVLLRDLGEIQLWASPLAYRISFLARARVRSRRLPVPG